VTALIDFAHFGLGNRGRYSHPESFAGLPIVEYDAAAPPATIDDQHAYRFSSDWDNENRFEEAWEHFASASRPATHIVVGPWNVDGGDDSSDAVERLVAAAPNLPNLRAIYFGDITSEENEMSWIQQSDVSPLLAAFPSLEVFRVRGGLNLAMTANSHANLRALAVETGGMDVSTLRSVVTGNFPELEHLELWLGEQNYGLSATVEDLQPLLAGSLFPKLRYLGLRNCEFADDIAGVIVNSPVLSRIENLDLSMGTLTDDGAQALLQLPTGGPLLSLDVNHNFMSDAMASKLTELPLTVDAGDRQADEDWRFVAIGE